jgi:copper homeostasis protein
MTTDPILIEVAVDSVASAIAAERGGARRLEICSSLIEGGVTPSIGLIEQTRAATSIALYVIIRPRGGDFLYDAQEFGTMRRDITAAKKMGADGIVLGILKADGQIDTARTSELVDWARPLRVTFHRAFDMSPDLFRSLEDICTTGVDRVLTSGGEQTAPLGLKAIGELVKAAGTRIAVMPGSGIDEHNVRNVVEQTGAREIHVGLRSALNGPMQYQKKVSMGSVPDREYQRFVVVEERVRKLLRSASGLDGA